MPQQHLPSMLLAAISLDVTPRAYIHDLAEAAQYMAHLKETFLLEGPSSHFYIARTARVHAQMTSCAPSTAACISSAAVEPLRHGLG